MPGCPARLHCTWKAIIGKDDAAIAMIKAEKGLLHPKKKDPANKYVKVTKTLRGKKKTILIGYNDLDVGNRHVMISHQHMEAISTRK